LIGFGLLIALCSGLISLFKLKPFMTGLWLHANLPILGEFHLGTPLLFDLGVYFVVVGITTHIIFTLAEE
jgi:multicomponent Na+:H+ antiporter subunit B